MATITRLKAEINNKNLPVITSDGEITNYYLGVFLNKIKDKGYTPTQTETTALNTFIQSAISNGYIDYIQYMLPFIGDSNNPSAGTVPLIDNVDNYAMTEYDGTEDYSTNFFEFDGNGKIKSIHNTRKEQNSDYIKTPVTYDMLGKRFSIFMNMNVPALTNQNIPLMSQDINEGGIYHYIRLRIQRKTNFTTEIMTDSDNTINISNLSGSTLETAVANNYNMNMGARYFEKENDDKLWGGSFAEFSSTKLVKTPVRTNVNNWVERNYGKYKVGRNMVDIYLKCMAFLDVNTPQSLYDSISSDVFTLVRALGRG